MNHFNGEIMQRINHCLGYDSRWIGQHGIGRFAGEIHSRLKFEHNYDAANSPTGVFSSYHLGRWLESNKAKGLYSPGYIPPTGTRLPFIFTVHDLNHLDVPHNSSIFKRLYYQQIILPGINKAHRVLTVSEYSKKRIIEWSHCDAQKVHVVGNGVSDNFNSNISPMMPGYPYFFCCSNRKGHKNEPRLLKAFAYSQLGKNFKIVFTGDSDIESNKLINALNLENNVIFTGKISETELAAWYKGALATIFPSLYEGFGLPIIESMACGTPVIASNTTSLPEVGGNSAQYFDPLEIESISASMCEVANNDELRELMRANGLMQVKKFSWDKTAALVSNALADLT